MPAQPEVHLESWILLIQWITRAVLVLLLALSVWSVSIMLDRRKALKSAAGNLKSGTLQSAKDLIRAGDRKSLLEWARAQDGLAGGTLVAALESGTHPESIDRAVKSFLTEERSRLERGLTVLATLGSNAPFIGLFGTVLGIIQAFGQLAQNTQGTAGVMRAISEALVATAIGLFVAIPAVVSYNLFSKRIRTVLSGCEVLRDLYVSRLSGG